MHSRIETPPARPHTLLVVDDERPILDLLGEALTEEGLRVTLAADLPAAVAALGHDRFDLILADSLAEFDSDFALDQWPALETIKTRAGTSRVVIFSAHPQRHFARWQARGFAGFIAKPFDLDELVETIRVYLSAERAGALSDDTVGTASRAPHAR
ncbi:MAG TPA: response regulator [Thermomicrobiales bacterium]|jgi:CheY-like chemotaxis protein